MTIKHIEEKGIWDTFVDDSPYGMLFHKWDLLKIIEKHTGYDLFTCGIYKGDELIGAVPIYYKKVKGVKLVYSPPQGTLVYIPYMGLIMSRRYIELKQRKRESYLDLAWADINRELKSLSANFSSFTFVPRMNDIRPFIWDGYDVKILYTYTFDLQRPLDEIWDSFDQECRKNIKDCAKYGLSIKQTTDVDKYYQIMANGLKDQGNTFFQRQSPDYLKDLLAAYPENIKMYFLYKDNDIIGVNVNCLYKDWYMGWGGDAVIQHEIKSNEYFNWETIKMAKAAGYKYYENWGADMKRLNQFKTKFNPTLVPYYHIRKKDTIGKLSEWGYDTISNSPLSFIKKIIS
jgi:hypothetical protein